MKLTHACSVALSCLVAMTWARAQSPLLITSMSGDGRLTWTNADAPGVVSVQSGQLNGGWMPEQNAFSLSSTGQTRVAVDAGDRLFRILSVSVAPTVEGFANLVQSYGLLESIAGDGAGRDEGVSYWQPHFEGGQGAFASLSRPHYAMADAAGNIYIADKNSHSVLRLTTNGTIHTHAGTHVGGFNGEGPMPATDVQLNFPNALWARSDGTVYVLDTDNGRVRRITTNGIASTMFLAKADGTALGGGRCLWVKDDETLAYFGNTDRIRKWTPSNGLQTLASGFSELGTFYVEPSGNLIVADRGAHRVYRVFTDGSRVTIAGNGTTSGGGDGSPALQTGFNGPRGVWPMPTGGYLLLLHDGARLWYVDSGNIARLLLYGTGGNNWVHAGDGQHFYAPEEARIGEGRSVSMDTAGNILVCESDYGFIRRIRFQRMNLEE